MYLVGSVLFEADELLMKLLNDLVPRGVPSDAQVGGLHSSLGVVRNGQVVGGAIFFNNRGHDIEVCAGFLNPRWATPATMRSLLAYPFVQLGCKRATAITARKNKAARRLLEGMGCRVEGVKRYGFDGKQDAIYYGLIKEDARWLKVKTDEHA